MIPAEVKKACSRARNAAALWASSFGPRNFGLVNFGLVTHGGLAATPKDENRGWTITRGDVGPPWCQEPEN